MSGFRRGEVALSLGAAAFSQAAAALCTAGGVLGLTALVFIPAVLVLCPDVIFSVQLQMMTKKLGAHRFRFGFIRNFTVQPLIRLEGIPRIFSERQKRQIL